MANTKEIAINGVAVTVSQPYAEGHAVNAAEAAALNQVRAENIANNTRKKIKEMLEVEGATPESVAKEAQKLVGDYDKDYEFTMASVGGARTKLDPITKEARAVAKNWLMSQLKDKGTTRKAYEEKHGEGAFMSKVLEVAENEKVIALAKKNLAARQKLAEGVGDDLAI